MWSSVIFGCVSGAFYVYRKNAGKNRKNCFARAVLGLG